MQEVLVKKKDKRSGADKTLNHKPGDMSLCLAKMSRWVKKTCHIGKKNV